MKRLATVLVVVATGLAAVAPVHASPDEQRREAAKERWERMTPEQREAAKAKARERWNDMTPEEQAAAKKRMAERHPDAAGKIADRKADRKPGVEAAPAK